MNSKVLLSLKMDLFPYFEIESVLNQSMKQDGPNSTSKLGNIYSAACKRLGGKTSEKEDLYIPGFLCVFSLSICYWTLLKKDARHEEPLV